MKDILNWAGAIGLIVLSVLISFCIVRFVASHFAKPKPWQWEYAYVLDSPNIRSYHYSDGCKYIKKSIYDIVEIPRVEAEEEELQPCTYCLKDSIKNEYDDYAMVIFFPVILLIVWLYSRIEKFFKTYKFQSPLTKKYV